MNSEEETLSEEESGKISRVTFLSDLFLRKKIGEEHFERWGTRYVKGSARWSPTGIEYDVERQLGISPVTCSLYRRFWMESVPDYLERVTFLLSGKETTVEEAILMLESEGIS